jgi:hypothetical protein
MISCSSSSYVEEFMILNAGAAAADQISIKIANLGNLQTNEILHFISTKKKTLNCGSYYLYICATIQFISC